MLKEDEEISMVSPELAPGRLLFNLYTSKRATASPVQPKKLNIHVT